MYKSIFNKRTSILFKHFSNKQYALFSVLGKEVLIGTLSIATLSNAKAEGISVNASKADSTFLYHGKEVKLNEVLVTAARAPQASGQQTRMVTVLSREDLKAIPAQSVNDLLKYVVGIDVRQRGPIGAQTDVGLRGGNQEQVTLLLNGINICDPQTGHNTFDVPIDMNEIERIEILKGPSGRVYGTSSLFGAINIITKQAVNNSLHSFVKAGSYGFLSAGVGVHTLKGAVSNALSGSYTRSDGYSHDKKGHHNMDFEGGKAFYQGVYNTNELNVQWHAGISSKGFGSNYFYGPSDNQYEHTFKTFTAIQAETKTGKIHFKPAIYWNRNMDRYEWNRSTPVPVKFNYNRTDVYGLNLNSYFDWFAGRTAFGAEIRNEDLVSGHMGELLSTPRHIHGTDRDYTHGLNRTNISFVAEHNLSWQAFNASFGFIATKNSWAEMNMRVYPGVDLSYRLTPESKLYASYSSSLRMPSVTELYYKYKGYEPNKHLKPEELSAFEIGYKYHSNAIQAEIALYHNHLTNMIDWVKRINPDNQFVWKSVNFGVINSMGVETGLHFNLQQLIPAQHFFKSFQVAYTYTHQKVENNKEIESRNVLEYLRHKASAILLMEPITNVSWSMMYRFSDRMGTFTNKEKQVTSYKPYGVLDTRLTYTQPRYTVFVEANNLLDKTYFDFGNVPQPGFWFMAGASFNINL